MQSSSFLCALFHGCLWSPLAVPPFAAVPQFAWEPAARCAAKCWSASRVTAAFASFRSWCAWPGPMNWNGLSHRHRVHWSSRLRDCGSGSSILFRNGQTSCGDLCQVDLPRRILRESWISGGETRCQQCVGHHDPTHGRWRRRRPMVGGSSLLPPASFQRSESTTNRLGAGPLEIWSFRQSLHSCNALSHRCPWRPRSLFLALYASQWP